MNLPIIRWKNADCNFSESSWRLKMSCWVRPTVWNPNTFNKMFLPEKLLKWLLDCQNTSVSILPALCYDSNHHIILKHSVPPTRVLCWSGVYETCTVAASSTITISGEQTVARARWPAFPLTGGSIVSDDNALKQRTATSPTPPVQNNILSPSSASFLTQRRPTSCRKEILASLLLESWNMKINTYT